MGIKQAHDQPANDEEGVRSLLIARLSDAPIDRLRKLAGFLDYLEIEAEVGPGKVVLNIIRVQEN